jgi:hypothetical protein
MSLKSKHELLEVVRPRYLKASKDKKNKNARRVYVRHWLPSEVCNPNSKKQSASSKPPLKNKTYRTFAYTGMKA